MDEISVTQWVQLMLCSYRWEDWKTGWWIGGVERVVYPQSTSCLTIPWTSSKILGAGRQTWYNSEFELWLWESISVTRSVHRAFNSIVVTMWFFYMNQLVPSFEWSFTFAAAAFILDASVKLIQQPRYPGCMVYSWATAVSSLSLRKAIRSKIKLPWESNKNLFSWTVRKAILVQADAVCPRLFWMALVLWDHICEHTCDSNFVKTGDLEPVLIMKDSRKVDPVNQLHFEL